MTNKNPENNKFIKDYGFLVEGSTDKNFIQDFLKEFLKNEKIDKKNYEVKQINHKNIEGGKANFFKINHIGALINENNQNNFTLVLIIDADSELETNSGQPAGFKEVDKKIKEIIKEINSNDFYKNVEILHYIMPFHDKQNFGQLEDLFIKSLNSKYKKKFEECLQPYQECLEKKDPKPNVVKHKMPKVQMEILLKSFNKDLSRHNLMEWIDYNHESLNNFKKFLINEVFKIKSS
jgi:hypothetical protein